MKYVFYEIYPMKFRMYPNKKQTEQLDTLIHAAHVFYNSALYDMLNNGINLIEKPDKKEPDKIVHFPDFSAMGKAAYIDKLREEYPITAYLPGAAISSIKCGIINDMKKSWTSTGKMPIEAWGKKYTDKNGNQITIGCRYYNKKKPRSSYAYQTQVNNLHITNNNKSLRVKISSQKYPLDGLVKIKSDYSKFRFDDHYEKSLFDWIKEHPRENVVFRIKKDKCGDYFLIVQMKNVYKPVNEPEDKFEITGIDVGEQNIAAISEEFPNESPYRKLEEGGTLYDSIVTYNPKYNSLSDRSSEIDYKMSKCWGWKNQKFKEAHKKDMSIVPSKRYYRLQKKNNQIERKRQRQQEAYYHIVTSELALSSKRIAIETLKVSEMKEKKAKDEKRT